MPTSPRLALPYPAENQDPWFDAFEALVNAIDSSLYAEQEDRNTLLMRGGMFSFDAGADQLSWSDTIELLSASVGFLWTVAANTVIIEDGQVLYAVTVRAPTVNTGLTIGVSAQLPSGVDGNDYLVLAVRRSNRIYFRNGNILQDGQSLNILETQGFRETIPLVLNVNTDQSTLQSGGAFALDPTVYEGGYIRLLVVAYITNALTTGEIVLYNLTDSVTVTTITYTGVGSLTPTKQVSVPLTLVASEKIYEIRFRVTGGTPPADKVYLMWAGFQIG